MTATTPTHTHLLEGTLTLSPSTTVLHVTLLLAKRPSLEAVAYREREVAIQRHLADRAKEGSATRQAAATTTANHVDTHTHTHTDLTTTRQCASSNLPTQRLQLSFHEPLLAVKQAHRDAAEPNWTALSNQARLRRTPATMGKCSVLYV